jgi:hypothetical protein
MIIIEVFQNNNNNNNQCLEDGIADDYELHIRQWTVLLVHSIAIQSKVYS